jgi:hypothetical protein
MSTALVINRLVTVIGENLCHLQSPAVCSSVLDLLQLPVPLQALPPSLEPGSRGPATATSTTVACTWFPGAPPESAILAHPGSWEWKLNNPASTATRQQFLFALLEKRSFFAHLVLRCVRAARNSSSPWGTPRSAQPGSNSQPANTQSLSNLIAQRSRQNPLAHEAESVSLPTLWVDVACRWVQGQRSREGIS